MDAPPGKTVSSTRVQIAQLMQPEHANNWGNVHGGWIIKLMDEAGALACIRHAQRRVVTIAIDQTVFRQPIRIGDLVIITAEVSYVGRTSMEAEVQVTAEDPVTGECTHTNTGYFVYVALDNEGKPANVPPLIPETDVHIARMKAGRARQLRRLNQRKNNPEDVD